MSTSTQLVTEPNDTDRAAIAALTERVAAAWAAHDAAAFAEEFVADATMILTGVYCAGSAAVLDFLVKAFQGPFKGTTVVGTPISLRMLGDNTAILLSRGGVVAPGETEPSHERTIHASWV